MSNNSRDIYRVDKVEVPVETVDNTETNAILRKLVTTVTASSTVVSASLNLLSLPYERARTLLQADFSSVRVGENLNPKSPLTRFVQINPSSYKTYSASAPNPWKEYYSQLNSSGKAPKQISLTSYKQVLSRLVQNNGKAALFSGIVPTQVTSLIFNAMGCSFILPMVLSSKTKDFLKVTDNEAAALTTMAFAAFFNIFLYPVQSHVTRCHVDRCALYPPVSQTGPSFIEFSKNLKQVVKKNDIGMIGRYFKINNPQTHLTPTFRHVIRTFERDGPFGFFRGSSMNFLTLSTYMSMYYATYKATSIPTIQKWLDPQNSSVYSYGMKMLAPAVVASLAAQYIAYPISTIRSNVLAVDLPGYVSHTMDAPTLKEPVKNVASLPLIKSRPLPLAYSAQVAFHEIYRQEGIRGFWKGASIIPFVRTPHLIAQFTILWSIINYIIPPTPGSAYPVNPAVLTHKHLI